MAKKLQTRLYDAAAYLKNREGCALYLQAALGDIARARGMMQLARDTGLTREGLYKALRIAKPSYDNSRLDPAHRNGSRNKRKPQDC